MANSVQDEVNDLIRKLYLVGDNAKRQSKSALGKAAKPLIAAIQAKAPVSDHPHSRGKKPKITYQPGNLRKSIKKLVFRRSAAVFVGPLSKDGVLPDGYYAPWVEYGTMNMPPHPFVRPAVAQVGDSVLRLAVDELKREIEKHARSIAV